MKENHIHLKARLFSYLGRVFNFIAGGYFAFVNSRHMYFDKTSPLYVGDFSIGKYGVNSHCIDAFGYQGIVFPASLSSYMLILSFVRINGYIFQRNTGAVGRIRRMFFQTLYGMHA